MRRSETYIAKENTGLMKKDDALITEDRGAGTEDFWNREFWRTRVYLYLKLIRADQPFGTLLVFWPCSWSVLMACYASAVPFTHTLYYLALLFAYSFVTFSTACIINDMCDREFDKEVERCKHRPLAAGEINTKEWTVLFGVFVCIFVTVILQFNNSSVILGICSLGLLFIYPLAKRFTNYPALVLAPATNWGSFLGWSAVRDELDLSICVPLFLAAAFWTIVYDTIYGLQDKEDDARIGVKSMALSFGSRTRLLMAVSSVLAMVGFILAGVAAGLRCPYYILLQLVTVQLYRQVFTVDMDNPEDCNSKYLSNTTIGIVVFLSILVGTWD